MILSGKDRIVADKKKAVQLPQPSAAEVEFAQQLVERAKTDGVSLVGPGGLLAGITRTVLESALDAELDAHLDEAGVDEESGRRANVRNGHGAKTVQTEVGPVRIHVPRDRAGSFTPRIVPKHARRLDGFNEAIGVAVCQRVDERGRSPRIWRMCMTPRCPGS